MLVQFKDRDGDAVGIDAEDVGNVFACSEHAADGCVLVRMKESTQGHYQAGAESTNVHLSGTTVEAVIATLNEAGA